MGKKEFARILGALVYKRWENNACTGVGQARSHSNINRRSGFSEGGLNHV